MGTKGKRIRIVTLFISTFVLILYMPVNGEEKKASESTDIQEILKGNITLMYISPQNTKSSFFSASRNIDASLKLNKLVKTNPLENSLFTASLIAFVTLNAADYFTTIKALKYEGVQECNPFMKLFIKKTYVLAVVKFGMTALNYKLMKSIYKKDKRTAWVVSTISNILIIYVVVNNFKLIQQVQGL